MVSDSLFASAVSLCNDAVCCVRPAPVLCGLRTIVCSRVMVRTNICGRGSLLLCIAIGHIFAALYALSPLKLGALAAYLVVLSTAAYGAVNGIAS